MWQAEVFPVLHRAASCCHWSETLTLVVCMSCLRLSRLGLHCAVSLQVGQMTQAGLLEHLKLENVSLSHRLADTQQRSIKEKERVAAQLQSIEVRAAAGAAADDIDPSLDTLVINVISIHKHSINVSFGS